MSIPAAVPVMTSEQVAEAVKRISPHWESYQDFRQVVVYVMRENAERIPSQVSADEVIEYLVRHKLLVRELGKLTLS